MSDCILWLLRILSQKKLLKLRNFFVSLGVTVVRTPNPPVRQTARPVRQSRQINENLPVSIHYFLEVTFRLFVVF